MNKTVVILLALVCCIITCCAAILVVMPGYQNEVDKAYFEEYQDEFESAQAEYEGDVCVDNVVSNVRIGPKKFDIYLNCELSSMVFETGVTTGLGRLDYVYIEDDSEVMEVDECSDRNGNYSKQLAPNWHLCYGDWN